MFNYFKNLANKYSKAWLNFTNFGKAENLFSIDFSKKFWSVLVRKKILFAFILSGVVLSRFVRTLLPKLLASGVKSNNINYFLWLALILVLVESYRYLTYVQCSKLIASIMSGLRHSAYKFFLTVDPVFHAKKSTGEVFGKIERCAYAYEQLIDAGIYDILPTIVGIVTVVGTFFVINIKLGLMAFLFLGIICIFNSFIILFNGLAFEKKVIKADDDAKKASIETLIQIQLVRSSFATNEVVAEVEGRNIAYLEIDGTYYIAFHTCMALTRIIYSVFICILGVYILDLIKSGTITTLDGAAFLATYLQGTYDTVKIGNRLQQFVRSVTRINDLFSFIKSFGKKSFPVLKDDAAKVYDAPTEDVISLKANNVYFAYKDLPILRGHNMDFVIPQAQENKLYGIIGPSGAGKTTFISILGGQIKPYIGSIEINNIPVYEINDNFKRTIIAIQGQSASSLSGTLKDNLLLGIPKNTSLFQDEYIIEVLNRVGIWEIFKDKNGLNSIIDEGGVNLSVGQRQRLNFAALYIRTKYYDPLLVLIDEPTSSLDEVSEQAITDMIHEIAKNSLVFVIAHRLRTLDDAVAIMDFSLLSEEKNIVFHDRQELEAKSEFYQKLISGEVTIED